MADQNGSGPQIKRRETWIDLPDEYDGFRIKVWVNAPSALWRQMSMGDTDESPEAQEAASKLIQEAASKLVLEHNGWLDFEGKPYPPIGPEFWDEIPTELAATMIAAANAEMMKLPNSLKPNRRRSKRG